MKDKKSLIVVATAAALVTVIFGTIFVMGQQSIRLSANMPQIQIAQDVAHKLNGGAKPESVVTTDNKVDLATSSSGFVIIYDKSGKVITGSGQLEGSIPVIPYGVLQHTQSPGYNAITWQPKADVRIASIEVATDKYYVLAGRSLSEPEKLIGTIGKLTIMGYVMAMALLLSGWFVYTKTKPL